MQEIIDGRRAKRRNHNKRRRKGRMKEKQYIRENRIDKRMKETIHRENEE